MFYLGLRFSMITMNKHKNSVILTLQGHPTTHVQVGPPHEVFYLDQVSNDNTEQVRKFNFSIIAEASNHSSSDLALSES